MSVYLRKGSKVYWCQFYINGEKVRKSTGETDKARAKVAERRIRADEEAKPRAAAPDRGITLGDLCAHDVLRAEAMKRDLNPQTVPTIKIFWSHLIRFFGEVHPGKVTSEGIDGYVAHRRRQKIRGQSIRRELQALKRGLKIAKRKGWVGQIPDDWPRIHKDPANPAQKSKKHPPKMLAEFLKELRERSQDAVDEAAIALLTGLRGTELKRFSADWIEPSLDPNDPVPGLIRMPDWGTKNKKGRVVAIPHAAMAIIKRRLLNATRDDAPILCQGSHRTVYRQASAELKKKYGYSKRITLRDLRANWSTLTDQRAGDRKAIQDAMGHSKPEITELYIHGSEDRVKALGPHTEAWYDELIAPAIGTAEKAQPLGSANFGRGERIRTFDPLTPSQQRRAKVQANSTYEQHQNAGHTEKTDEVGTDPRHSQQGTERLMAESVIDAATGGATLNEIHDRLLVLAKTIAGKQEDEP